MDRRSRSIERSPRRQRNNSRRDYRRSRTRSRSREKNYRRRLSRSPSREYPSTSHYHRESNEKDLYRELIYDDYRDRERNDRNERMERNERNDRMERNDRKDYRANNRPHGNRGESRRFEQQTERDSDDSDEFFTNNSGHNETPSNTILLRGLATHITEADITSALIQLGMAAASIRLIRERSTGASRGFAFVEFTTIDEAAHWMELTQGHLTLQDQTHATLQFSDKRDLPGGRSKQNMTDWYCGKCGIFNFKRRDFCFKCYASREESEKGEGSDEVSNILTKKIMLRNLDALTNEESVLTAMQQVVPDLAKKISKILVSRDALTQTSRGVCYLNFDTLVDSMNLHNELNALDPPLKIDNREVFVTYCIDHENRQIVPKKFGSEPAPGNSKAFNSGADLAAQSGVAMPSPVAEQYTLADVPRLAEYSAALYASNPAEHAHFLQYYTDYYVSEINKGQYANLPTDSQLTEANSGAAVALSAIQRKQKKMSHIETTATQAAAAAAAAAAAVKASLAAQTIVTPKGNDGKVYPTPDVSLYQYDETSGYYYDPTTGLYYDAHSQYYYNNETGAYLYWDQRKSTYVLATPAAAAATIKDVVKQETVEEEKASVPAPEEEVKKEKKDNNKHDKVKVAKKIVKDMEKWAKQLNQKKDYTVVATPQPIIQPKTEENVGRSQPYAPAAASFSGYADVGFSILEKKERTKLADYISTSVNANSYGSDSEDEHAAGPSVSASRGAAAEASESDYVDFQKLTCLLCKRAFQSLDILQKHLKMSNLHKENLQKYKMTRSAMDEEPGGSALSYRDRAKERRLKYGESDPPPPNRSRERFEHEIKSMSSRQGGEAPAMPIGSNNVGNRLLQKMGWSEGQGLGRKNQGRTNIIEADTRSTTAGLGTKSGIGPGDDYKTYIKKMMKSRYESV